MVKPKISLSLTLDWDNILKKGTSAYIPSSVVSSISTKDDMTFCTGSKYSGKWNNLGMTSFGSYTYPQRCRYDGEFEDGMFHGKGTIKFPMGQKLCGLWHKGRMISYKFTFGDGMEVAKNYCVMPDRRYLKEVKDGLKPAFEENLISAKNDRPIPPSSYDMGCGFFSTLTRSVTPAFDPEEFPETSAEEDLEVPEDKDDGNTFPANKFLIVSGAREEWIKSHCRKAWDEPSGYRPDFYPDWVTARKQELDELDAKYEIKPVPGGIDTESMNIDVVTPTTVYARTGRKLLPGSTIDIFLKESDNTDGHTK